MTIIDEQQAYNYCIKLLARREYSQCELNTKLTRQHVGNEVIVACLSRLISDNYQSDERFTEMFVRTKVSQRYGEKKIRYELQQKGINEELINHYLPLYEADFLDNAICLIKKKISAEQKASAYLDRKNKAKIIRFLLGKGYDYQVIQQAFNEVLS